MTRSSTGAARTSGLALALLCTTAVIELLALGIAATGFDEVADASPFGERGTVAAALILAVTALVGAVCAWREVSGALRIAVVVLVFAGVGILALMTFFFLIAGGASIIFAVLMAHATFSLALIGRAVLQAAAANEGLRHAP